MCRCESMYVHCWYPKWKMMNSFFSGIISSYLFLSDQTIKSISCNLSKHWSIGTMGFFSLSDIIITITLLVNATALMSSKVYADPRTSTTHESGESSGLLTSSENNHSSEDTTISRFYMFLNWIRRLSCLIVVWNIFFIILMLFVFRS